MDTNLELVDGVAVLELLADAVDVTSADDLRGRLGDLAAEHPNLVVDLGRVGFLDSTGCGALVGAQRRFREAGGDLRLCSPTPAVKTVLDFARVGRVLPVYATREQAVASFGR